MPREGSELLRLETNAADEAIDIKQGAIFTTTCCWHQASMLVSRAFMGHAGLHLLCSSWEPLLHAHHRGPAAALACPRSQRGRLVLQAAGRPTGRGASGLLLPRLPSIAAGGSEAACAACGV